MNEEKDLSKYHIRTDLAIDEIDTKIKLKGVKSCIKKEKKPKLLMVIECHILVIMEEIKN